MMMDISSLSWDDLRELVTWAHAHKYKVSLEGLALELRK